MDEYTPVAQVVADYRAIVDRLARAERAGDPFGQARALGELLGNPRRQVTGQVRRDIAVRLANDHPEMSLAEIGDRIGVTKQALDLLCAGHPDRVARPAGRISRQERG